MLEQAPPIVLVVKAVRCVYAHASRKTEQMNGKAEHIRAKIAAKLGTGQYLWLGRAVRRKEDLS